jgi:hypothetical protein
MEEDLNKNVFFNSLVLMANCCMLTEMDGWMDGWTKQSHGGSTMSNHASDCAFGHGHTSEKLM